MRWNSVWNEFQLSKSIYKLTENKICDFFNFFKFFWTLNNHRRQYMKTTKSLSFNSSRPRLAAGNASPRWRTPTRARAGRPTLAEQWEHCPLGFYHHHVKHTCTNANAPQEESKRWNLLFRLLEIPLTYALWQWTPAGEVAINWSSRCHRWGQQVSQNVGILDKKFLT